MSVCVVVVVVERMWLLKMWEESHKNCECKDSFTQKVKGGIVEYCKGKCTNANNRPKLTGRCPCLSTIRSFDLTCTVVAVRYDYPAFLDKGQNENWGWSVLLAYSKPSRNGWASHSFKVRSARVRSPWRSKCESQLKPKGWVNVRSWMRILSLSWEAFYEGFLFTV